MLFLGVALIILGFLFGWRSVTGILIIGAGVLIATLDIVRTVRGAVKKQQIKKTKFEFDCIFVSGLPFEENNCKVKIYTERAEFIVNNKTATLELSKINNTAITDDIFNITYVNNNESNTIKLKINTSDNKIIQAQNYINENIKFEI